MIFTTKNIALALCMMLVSITQIVIAQENIAMDKLFDKALVAYDKEYLDVEHMLLNGGQAAVSTLQKQTQNSDPIACLMAGTLLERIRGQAPEQQNVVDYLDYIPKRLARTPLGKPSPQGVANDLNERFADGAVNFLALRLVKQRKWPSWKVMGILFYLKSNNKPSIHSALIRFATETNNEEWQKLVIEILQIENDKESLKKKVKYEKTRLENMKQKFPDILKVLIKE